MNICLICGASATHAIEDAIEGVYIFSCADHLDKCLDRMEDQKLLELIKERTKNDNGVRHTLEDLKKRHEV